MKKTIVFLFSATVLLFTAGCKQGDGFKKTKSGLLYKIISDKKGPVVKRGEFIKVNFTQKVRDSILGSSYNGMPTYAPVDSVGAVYNPAELFPLLRKGDSLVVVMLADTLFKKNNGELPPYIRRKDKITLTIKVLDILPSEDLVRKDQQTLITTQKDKEIQIIEAYLNKNNITATKTSNGVFFEIQSPGSGPKADSGKMVAIRYTGYTFYGQYFDSNIDSTKQSPTGRHPLDPYEFQSGVQGAIAGMLEGIQQFNKGSKGRLFIPSMLAYGSNPPPGATFKPFDNLIFDVEVLDVKQAPAMQGQPVPQF